MWDINEYKFVQLKLIMKMMKKLLYPLLIVLFFSCSEGAQEAAWGGYSNENAVLKGDKMSPETLWLFGRVGNVLLSPDKARVLYSVTWPDVSANRTYRDLYLMDVGGSNRTQLTRTEENESQATWSEDGQRVYFLSPKNGSMQLYAIGVDGTGLQQLSNEKEGIQGYKFSPGEKRIAIVKGVKRPTVADKYPDMKEANVRIEDDLMYRHWDSWVDEYAHIFIGEVGESGVKNVIDIMEGKPWEAPVRPFGGMEQVTWTPDGKALIYCSRKKVGVEYSFSTNTDLYCYDLKDKQTTNLSAENKGYDLNPCFSPKGDYLVWESMERDGYEADVTRLAIMDYAGKKIKFKEFEGLNVHGINWAVQGNMLYFVSNWHGTNNVYSYDLDKDELLTVAVDTCNYLSVEDCGTSLLLTRQSMSKPTEIYTLDKNKGDLKEISHVNQKLLNQLKLGRVEARWIKTFDKKDMLAWVIYPPDFDPNKKYPALLYCQGGPQSTVSQFFSYRWNFQLMAANDYIIIAPNRRGLPGFGQEWNEQISGDYGGANMKDYLKAIDELAKEPYVDSDRLGAIGASYGGYSVYWLAGNHDKRFKTFVSHCGIFNFEAMYLSTEEMWFVDWDYKGNFWDNNKKAQKSFDASPHRYIKNWDTPILCIHGAKDFRIPETQGMQAFQAAKLRGLPTRFLYFPEEGHWVLGPQNGMVWHREFYAWLDKWLKPAQE